jgi:hypothetical protein
MKNLLSMKEFVLDIENEIKKEDYQVVAWQEKITAIDRIFNYANSINQPLKKGMFVPCDEDDEILYPEYAGGKEVIYDSMVHDFVMDKVLEYQEAKEKVIFKGFEASKEKGVIKITNKIETFYFDIQKNKLYYKEIVYWKPVYIIEDLIKVNIELTENFKL